MWFSNKGNNDGASFQGNDSEKLSALIKEVVSLKSLLKGGAGAGTASEGVDILGESSDTDAMKNVSYGDRISFGHENPLVSASSISGSGFLHGDSAMRRCGVQLKPAEDNPLSLPNTSHDFSDCVFAIVPMLSYRNRAELRKFEKKRLQRERVATEKSGIGAASGDDDGEDLNLRKEKNLLDMRFASEIKQNAETLTSVLAGGGAPIKYGDTIQLLHSASHLFVKMHKKTATIDKDCRLVSLRDGAPGCLFKLMPRYKTRALGSTVFYGDDVVFESVLHEGLKLQNSHGKADEYSYPSVNKYGNGSQLPQALRRPQVTEVNGGPNTMVGNLNVFEEIHLLHFPPLIFSISLASN